MRKSVAAAGSAALSAVVPAIVAGLIPWYLTGWHGRGGSTNWLPVRIVGGLYRYVRNPMYLAVTTAIAGQALLLIRPVLLANGAVA